MWARTENFACRGMRLEPRGEDSAVLVQVGLSTRLDFASVSSRVGKLCHSIYLSRGFISAHCSSFVLTFPVLEIYFIQSFVCCNPEGVD